MFALRHNNNSCVQNYLGHPSFCHLSLSGAARRCHIGVLNGRGHGGREHEGKPLKTPVWGSHDPHLTKKRKKSWFNVNQSQQSTRLVSAQWNKGRYFLLSRKFVEEWWRTVHKSLPKCTISELLSLLWALKTTAVFHENHSGSFVCLSWHTPENTTSSREYAVHLILFRPLLPSLQISTAFQVQRFHLFPSVDDRPRTRYVIESSLLIKLQRLSERHNESRSAGVRGISPR